MYVCASWGWLSPRDRVVGFPLAEKRHGGAGRGHPGWQIVILTWQSYSDGDSTRGVKPARRHDTAHWADDVRHREARVERCWRLVRSTFTCRLTGEKNQDGGVWPGSSKQKWLLTMTRNRVFFWNTVIDSRNPPFSTESCDCSNGLYTLHLVRI